jgi:hypothetical protein
MAAGFRGPLPLLRLGTTPAGAGFRSFIGFWLGGLGTTEAVEEPEPEVGGGVRREITRRRPLDRPARRIDERTETRPQEAPVESVGTQTPTTPRTHAVEAASPQRGTSAQMLRAELAQIETRAREREAQFAALQAQMSALGAEAAEMAELQAARKRDNNRRAQILIALLMMD